MLYTLQNFFKTKQTKNKYRFLNWIIFSSVQSLMSDSLRPHESQHARPPCPTPTPRVYPDSRPLSQWCHPAISSSVVPFSSCPQSLPASGSFPKSQLFTSGGQILQYNIKSLKTEKINHHVLNVKIFDFYYKDLYNRIFTVEEGY